MKPRATPRHYQYQRGLSLVELMVALAISLFLLAGLYYVFFGMKRSYQDAQALAGLQDNQLLASSVLTNTLQNAGYFPYSSTVPSLGSRSDAFPAASTSSPTISWPSGQVIQISSLSITLPNGSSPGGNSLSVRLIPTDQALNCLGNPGPSTVTSTSVQTNTLTLINTSASPYSLACQVQQGATVSTTAIVSPLGNPAFNPNGSGLAGMQVTQIGLASSGSAQVDNYKTPTNMTATDWPNARTLTVQLKFFNPLFDANHTAAGSSQDSQGQPRYVSVSRVIGLENLEP